MINVSLKIAMYSMINVLDYFLNHYHIVMIKYKILIINKYTFLLMFKYQ